ncbi:MAG TPA: NfeD family protein [Candidatus Acidoferrum sp.]|jgi:membrane protein implicated in regulation of membrane protease activity
MGNWVNWLLVIVGVLCAAAELALGALTGFDLALVGASLAAGGAVGLIMQSWHAGLISAAIFAFLYFALFRRWLKTRLVVTNKASNVDTLIGKMGVVTKRIGQRDCGIVKVGSEEWRAELVQPADTPREIGADVQVVSVEGVTLKVK